MNLQVIHNQLTLHHYQVIEAINGIEALALIERGLLPDLILLDVMMPRMSGYEVCRQLRQKFAAQELPVILLTAKNQAADLIEGFSSGANDYLTKPFSKHELLARIKLHIQLTQATHELIEQEAIVRDYARNLESTNLQLQQSQSHLEERVEQRTAELKDTQQQLIETEKMALLGGLVAGVAHEINTPVGIGVTASSFLLDEINHIRKKYEQGEITHDDFNDFLQKAVQTANMIVSNLRRAAELVKSFKQVAVDQSTEDLRHFKLREYIEEVLMTLHPRLKMTHHKIELEVDPLLEIDSYPGTFSQIFTNLLMNSLTHAFADSDSGRIRIAAYRQDEHLIIA
ncbi:MAG TPA: response regulator, partial [Aggregatilineales bacterium]|nr:response regulator [Aggregatilineales bacterium]